MEKATESLFSFRQKDYVPKAWQFKIGGFLLVEWGRTYTHGKRFFLVQLRVGKRGW